jgi:hypothetical protein
MRDNMTNSEQTKWVIQETGRQIAAAAHWVFIESIQNVHQVIFIEAPWAVRQAIRRRRFLQEKFAALTDETLIDRILGTHEIPVRGDDQPMTIPVRVIARRLQLIQDIR